VLLPVLFAMLLCLGWQLLHEAAACTVVHAAAKHFICGFQHGAAGVVGTLPAVAVAVSVLHAKNRLFQAMFRQLVVANSSVCWVVLEGVFGSAQ
jgi:multisubunit Na+/H+ antiporter MnhE subunit